MSTLFSRIIHRELDAHIVFEQDEFIAILDRAPINPGHILLIPFEEVEEVIDLSPQRYQAIWLLVQKFSAVLKLAFNAPKVGIVVEGFGVPHAHIHLIPIYQGNQLNPERAKEASNEELAEAADKIRNALAHR